VLDPLERCLPDLAPGERLYDPLGSAPRLELSSCSIRRGCSTGRRDLRRHFDACQQWPAFKGLLHSYAMLNLVPEELLEI
jgi:hypothetical protein